MVVGANKVARSAGQVSAVVRTGNRANVAAELRTGGVRSRHRWLVWALFREYQQSGREMKPAK